MSLDIRIPLGLMFSVLGLVLVAYGLMSDPAIYARSLGYNVNLIWGAVLLGFGTVVLVIAYRSARSGAR
jgi:hypothetical protein